MNLEMNMDSPYWNEVSRIRAWGDATLLGLVQDKPSGATALLRNPQSGNELFEQLVRECARLLHRLPVGFDDRFLPTLEYLHRRLTGLPVMAVPDMTEFKRLLRLFSRLLQLSQKPLKTPSLAPPSAPQSASYDTTTEH